MNRASILSGLAIVTVASLSLFSSAAFADNEACARAYEKAQKRRLDAKLIEARRELVACAQDSCPALLRRDCVKWLDDVETEVPAISIRVRGVDGCDRSDADVIIDGTPIPKAAEGRLIDVDPGAHVVRAKIGRDESEQNVVVSTGERRRVVTIELGPNVVCGVPPAPRLERIEQPAKSETKSETQKTPTSVFILGAGGLLGAGLTTAFGISAWSQKGTLDECKGACVQRDVDTMKRTFIVADVLGVITIASLAVTTFLYFKR